MLSVSSATTFAQPEAAHAAFTRSLYICVKLAFDDALRTMILSILKCFSPWKCD